MEFEKISKQIKKHFLEHMGQRFPESCMKSVKEVLRKYQIKEAE